MAKPQFRHFEVDRLGRNRCVSDRLICDPAALSSILPCAPMTISPSAPTSADTIVPPASHPSLSGRLARPVTKLVRLLKSSCSIAFAVTLFLFSASALAYDERIEFSPITAFSTDALKISFSGYNACGCCGYTSMPVLGRSGNSFVFTSVYVPPFPDGGG